MRWRPLSALKQYLTPEKPEPRTSREDPFETIKNALNSVSDQFSKLSSEFGAPKDLDLSPNALPDKDKLPRKPKSAERVSKVKAESLPDGTKSGSKRTPKIDSAGETNSSKAANSVPKKPAPKTSSAKTTAPKIASPKPPAKKPVAKKPAAQ